MATTLEVERQLSNAGYLPQGVDFSPRFSAPADIEGIVRGAASRYGIDPDQATAIARLESGLNPRAQNPTSSAGGLFQFINSTWNQYGGGDKYDPARNADAGARYLRDVRDTLTRGLGRAPTVGELYLGHQQGPAGALRILQNPDGLAKDAVGPDAVVLNGGTIGMTNRDFAARWDRKASRAAGQAPGILDTIGAAARQNIGLISLLGYGGPFHRGLDDPGFNAITTADADPALRPYLSQFIDVRNRDEYDRTAERIRRATEDKETIASAGIFGTVASVAAGILDPINLIPVGGGAWKLLKAGRYVEGALGGIIAGGGGAALQELVLQQADPTRTAEDAGLNIVSGALGGAGLGAGAVAAGESASRLARAGILGAGGAAGGAAAGLAEAVYSGQGLGDSLATIGTSAVIGGLLGGSVGALARPGRTAREGLRDLARSVDIATDTGNGAVYADVRRQLLAAGRPDVEADAGGRLWQSHVDAVAQASGLTQDEVYRGIGLDVRAGEVPEGALTQAAYHGTPHRFERFSTDAIGTGEGAQAYGWGLYFAEKRGVAEGYRAALTDRAPMQFASFTDEQNRRLPQWLARRIANDGEKAVDELIADFRARVAESEVEKAKSHQPWLVDSQITAQTETLNLLNKIKESSDFKPSTPRGQLYKVDVPEADVLLDWDAPLSAQPEKVKAALKALPGETKNKILAKDMGGNEPTGQLIYSRLSEIFGGAGGAGQKDASLELKDVGIEGIRYFDGGSRSAGEGSRNFVIFDDDAVKIAETFYQRQGQDARGAVELGDGMARITIGAKADASTFLHESAHVFLGTLDRLSAQSQELAADVAKVREWLGNDGGAITREQHERWARGFEAYLREGKAPNSALREVFERFRDWLTAIYRSLADLDVELSDDVRGVMDRLIGVDDEPAAGRGGSLSAAEMPVATMDDLRIARGVEGAARVVSRIPIVGGPDLILGTSPVRAARWAMRKLMRPVLATEGDLQRGGTWTEETLPDGRVVSVQRPVVATENVESAMQQWHGTEVVAKQRATDVYTDYVRAAAKAGEAALNRDQFFDAVSMAGRRGDSAAKLALGPEAQKAVTAAVKVYREEIFEPLTKQMLEHGLLTKSMIDKAKRFAESYMPRAWNINKILEKRNQFTNEVVMPQVVRDWEEARAKLARMRQTTRFADEQLRQIEAAGIEHGGPEAAAFIAEGPTLSPAQIMRENVKQLQAALDDPSVQWADGDEDRARMLIATSRTPVIARDGMEGIRKGGPALTAAEAQEVQDMLYRTRGLRPTDETDIGVRATRAVQAMRERAAALENAAKTASENKPLASMTPAQAEEASRMMAEQATKLTDDAAAVSTLADQYETALKKSLRERAKAYRTLDADDNLGRLDEEELPGVASDIVDALVGHTNNRLQYEPLKIQERGAMKEKTFNVRDDRVDGSRGGENWLENDIEHLAARFVRTVAPDLELKRLTGDLNAEPLRQQIIQEYTDKAAGMEDGPKKRALDKRLKRDLEAFDGVVSRLRGTYGLPKDAGDVWALRFSRIMKAFNFVRLMGNGPISQIGDVGRIVFRSGMTRFFGDAVMPMISNWDAVRLTKRELQQADIATELVRSSMALRGAEMFDEYSNISKVELAAQKVAAGASRLYGLDHWNQGGKTIAGMIAQSSLVDGVRKLAAGADMKPMEIADLSRVGIGAREAEFLRPFIDEFGRDVRGVTIPNTADWSGEGAADAARLWRGAMRQITDDMVINPGQDRSLFLSKPFRSLLFQLETFNLVSTQRTILVGLQRRDAGVLIGAGVMVGIGMLSYWLKAKIAGLVFGSTTTWKMPDSPGDWILQGVNQSGLLGVISSIDQRMLAATRGTVGSEALVGSPTRSRFAAADFSSLFGPTASAGQIAFTSIQNAAAGDWNWKDTHRLRSLAPMQNYFVVRGLYDQGEKWLNDRLGVRRPVAR